MKKALFVCPYYPPHLGGQEQYVKHIAGGLKEKFNWDVTVVTTSASAKKETKSTEDGLIVYRLPVAFTFSNTPINPLWYFNLKKIINTEKPDVINAHAPVPFLADLTAFVANPKKLVVTYHDGTMIKAESLFNIPIYLYEKYLLGLTLKKAKLVICCSDFVRKDFLGKFTKKSITINPGVESVGKIYKGKNGRRIVFVASITRAQKHKGLGLLLEAVAEIKKTISDIQLIVIGNGDAMRDYKKQAKELRIFKNVSFKGALYGNKLKKMVRKSDCFVLPTSKESFGMVVIEAMAQGTPPVASNVGGIPGIIANGVDGKLVPNGNLEKLVSSIKEVLENPEEAEVMGKKGIEKIKNNYLWDKQVKLTNSAFQKLI